MTQLKAIASHVANALKVIPRDYQNIAVDSIFQFFRDHPVDAHPIVKMPTGTGKSVVIAEFLRRAFEWYDNQRVLVLTHVKELVEQDYLEFIGMWPEAPAGVYSAGLKRKDLYSKITFAGVASIVKNIAKFGKIDLVLIDECHLVSDEEKSMYMKCISLLKQINKHVKIIGFTATDWREGMGVLTNGKIFTHVCVDMCDMISFNWFVKQGYLLPPVPKATKTFIDVSGVKIQGGEFKQDQLEFAANKDEVTWAALQEAVAIAQQEGRQHWLIFCAGLDHCEKVHLMLNYLGISNRVVSSKVPTERDENIKDFKAGKFTALINNGILTTGFNYKSIDMIIMLRPTASSKLWVQMLGRGTRPDYAPGFDLTTLEGRWGAIMASEKQNCLVLDFAKNSTRLGPINDPVIPGKKGPGKGEIPIKICDACGMYNHISARYCGGSPFRTNEGCGTEFIFKVLITENASTNPLVKESFPVIEVFQIDSAQYYPHVTKKGSKCVKASYRSGGRVFDEYILFELPALRFKVEAWWRQRSTQACPTTTDAALELLKDCDDPTHLRVRTDKPHPEVLAACFMGEFATAHTTDDVPF
jgi:DNA repair protein RadD